MPDLSDLIERARKAPKHIILAEGEDPRIVQGALMARDAGVAQITLLGSEHAVKSRLESLGADPNHLSIIDPQADKRFADHTLNDSGLNFANLMVMSGVADGSVAGAVHTTPDVVRSALKVIGVAEGLEWVSSLFLMIFPETHPAIQGGVVFSDCGLVIDPSAAQLVEIAAAAAQSGQRLLGLDPKIAMLSFSTKGSAKHESVDKVQTATRQLETRYPDLVVDGELQFDAAIMPDIAKSKASGSPVAGQANVFIFPDLNAGNIGYKIAERLGGAKAIGPILQGLAKPANDLSRGCTAEDVFNMIVVTVLQAQATH